MIMRSILLSSPLSIYSTWTLRDRFVSADPAKAGAAVRFTTSEGKDIIEPVREQAQTKRNNKDDGFVFKI